MYIWKTLPASLDDSERAIVGDEQADPSARPLDVDIRHFGAFTAFNRRSSLQRGTGLGATNPTQPVAPASCGAPAPTTEADDSQNASNKEKEEKERGWKVGSRVQP